ncbi:MAG: carboxynorspermidine decarboxylase [Opitutales bacterium]|nr:carboxynorspermidine decarboxylase [Opitutales bacterium]
MERQDLVKIRTQAPSPSFVVHLGLLRRNLEILDSVQQRTGAKILLALKGFAMFSTFPLIREYLQGICASSPDEAQLGREEFGREVHSFAPAFSDSDMEALIGLSDHIVFNSFSQWKKHRERVKASERRIECGLRINPEVSTGKVAIYDPCSPGSRLGIRRSQFEGESLDGIDGLHFHTLCEQNSDDLEKTLAGVEAQFGEFLPQMKWLNFGGGHHITRDDYDIDRLCRLIEHFRDRYDLQIYLEPGEAVALNTGVLIASVLDIVDAETPVAILDTSAQAHMPDVLEMPYRPVIVDGGDPSEKAHTYRLGGMTCLAGDVIGDWSFDAPLKPGDRLVFLDMGHYSMVKTTTFNGIRLPSIATFDPQSDQVKVVRTFGYEDYRNRLS